MYSTTEQTTVLLWKKIFPNTGLNTRVGQRDPFYCADVKALVVGNGDLSDNRCHVWRSIRPGYLLLHMWEAHGVGGGSSDVSRRDKSLRVRARVHAHHNGFFDMWSFTRGQKVMGEKGRKGKNWKLKIYLTFQESYQQQTWLIPPQSVSEIQTCWNKLKALICIWYWSCMHYAKLHFL